MYPLHLYCQFRSQNIVDITESKIVRRLQNTIAETQEAYDYGNMLSFVIQVLYETVLLLAYDITYMLYDFLHLFVIMDVRRPRVLYFFSPIMLYFAQLSILGVILMISAAPFYLSVRIVLSELLYNIGMCSFSSHYRFIRIWHC